MVKECADREGVGWDSLVLWKMDLRGAFHLLFIHPDSAQRLAFALGKDTEGVDLSVVFHTGIFGWTGMPGAFQVVTRVISRLVNARIWGKAMMYVDDLMGVSDLGHILSDLQAAREVCTGLLGEDAVEDRKTEYGRTIDWIGWQLDLDTRRVSISRRNFLRTLYGFMLVDENQPVKVRTIHRLASWSARYGAICRGLKPFTTELFNAVKGRVNEEALVSLLPSQRFVVDLWRSSLVLLELDPEGFSRPLESVLPREASILLKFDASLTGLVC
jgi:hypothetical protein